LIESNFSFWLATGICVGTVLLAALDNLPMGLSMGEGSGIPVLLLTPFKRMRTNKQ